MSDQPMATGADADAHALSGADILREEHDGLAQRRRLAYGDAAEWPACWTRTGMALSGGGIRSATFCLGLLRGLAQNGVLKRFDYLSTVSGGGFAGAMLGRLVSRLGIVGAEQALAGGRNLLLWWLRSNGRYLTPAGSRDLGMALVTYFRAWLAVQLEFAVACLLLGLLVVLPHVLQESFYFLSWDEWPAGHTPWWPAAVLWFAVTLPGPLAAYWIVRDPPMEGGAAAAAPAPAPAA
ncbi:MAG: hypothetical protein JWQ76_3036, partial [Ramlibacter sp.]|nr:hypothetical protein [Ramlibacter sp.]